MSRCNSSCHSTATQRLNGEVNSGVNLGDGEGVFESKLGLNLQFKSLVAGSGISLSSTNEEITIEANGASNFIFNQNSVDQLADFRITGDGILGGSLVIGTTATAGIIGTYDNLVRNSTTGAMEKQVVSLLSAPYIINQNSSDQTANFRIVGIGIIKGTNAIPSISGSAINGSLSLQANGVADTGLGIGVSGTGSYSWIQSRNPADYSVNRELRLNPNGGNISIGANTDNYATIIGITASQNRIRIESSITSFPFSNELIGISYRGTSSIRLPSQLNDTLFQITSAGQQDATTVGVGSSIAFVASENWNVSSKGTNIIFSTATNGTTSITTKTVLFNSGNQVWQNGGSFADAGYILDAFGTARLVGTNAAPSASGSAINGSLLLRSFGITNTGLSIGTNGTNGYSWIQSRNPLDYSVNRFLAINPNGGNVSIGTIIDANFKFDVQGTARIQNTIDVYGGGAVNIFGSDGASNITRTDSTNKSSRIGMPHFLNAEEPMALIMGANNSTANQVNIGGGSGILNTATLINFYTASNSVTLVGTVRAHIDSAGLFFLDTTPTISTSPTAKHLVRETTGEVRIIDGFINEIRAITATTTALLSDWTILCDATSGAITVNLPTASSSTGRVYNIKKINNTANNITIDPSGAELIDGAATFTLSTFNERVTIQSNGTSWYIIS